MARHLITGTDQPDNLVGEDPRDDLLYGLEGADNINTGSGNDLIYAGAGLDYVIAGLGDDLAFGGDDQDVLNGGAGNDTLRGEAGSDVLIGGFGLDLLYGGSGDDLLYSNGGPSGFQEKQLFGGAGNDRLIFAWNDFGTAEGGTGQDVLEVALYDGSGPPWDDVTVSLVAGNGTASFATTLLTFTGIETLDLQTYNGNDTVLAGAGDDVLSVHLGANVVDAGAGDDRVVWHTGSTNVLEGGLGRDTLVLSHTEGQPALVFSAAGGAVSDGYGSTLTGFETFEIYGWDRDDQAVLGSGADKFTAWSGNDTASGGAGHDILKGQLGDDLLQGDAGADWLNGGSGDDTVFGGLGNDVVLGGRGSDELTGGAGADQFRYTTFEQYFDHILDFTRGEDKLVFFRAYLGLTSEAEPTDPGFLAFDTPDAARGQFVFFQAGSSSPSELRWDADGTGISGGITVAILDGVDTLTAADFLLLG